MIVPRATYRLQFQPGFTLREGLELVPYLAALGVSHVYASPLLKARPGSPHGYDVCDPAAINPEIGSETDLEIFVSALRQRGMGLVLDIVPNHMAAIPDNPWWWDVLKHGRHSRFADHFDIDWDSPRPELRGKVLLPVLGDEAERVLERGELRVARENAELTVRYFDHRFPVSPESLRGLGEFSGEAGLNADRDALGRFLDRQHYRLVFWRHGDTLLNYRRFFAVAHLAGVRVELPQVFADTHDRILDWHQRGLLDGFRVDHPDGLSDPHDYLQRLSQAAPGAWIVVEKILGPGEELPADWPVAGTTGYDFLNRVNGLFIDPAGERPITGFYAEWTGEPTDYGRLVREKKRWVLRHLLNAEVTRLTRLLQRLAAGDERGARFSPDQLRTALEELAACCPVYRTYVRAGTGPLKPGDETGQGPNRVAPSPAHIREEDTAVVVETVAAARSERPELAGLLGYVGDLLLLRVQGGESGEFVMRFQQLTGPAMGKGVEDTAFYCFNRFAALNEVGGDPADFGVSVEEFHDACARTRQRWPRTMLATSTHDTKRSEDVRARLALLSEIPARWAEALRRWSAMNDKHWRGTRPDRNAEQFFYQTVVGAWPLGPERALAYMEKAAREAKQHTTWAEPNADHERCLRHFVTAVLGDRGFVEELERFVRPLLDPGYINSLAQTLVKLTAPGVPDIYQGTDLWDLSLVDPDNRRPVDFSLRREALLGIEQRLEAGELQALVEELVQDPADGRVKLFVIRQALGFRREHEALFREGDYVPVSAAGTRARHVCAFARTIEGATAVTVVPRLVLGLTAGQARPPIGAEVWQDTRLVLPRGQTGRPFANVFTGEVLRAREDGPDGSLLLAEVLGRFPVAFLGAPGARLPAPGRS